MASSKAVNLETLILPICAFVLLICRWYMFLCIHLPFGMWFFKVPNHSLFASQKKREVGLS